VWVRIHFANNFYSFCKLCFMYHRKHPKRVLTCAPQATESRVRSNNGKESSCTAGIGFRGKGSFLS
jgi:hypothetical protein